MAVNVEKENMNVRVAQRGWGGENRGWHGKNQKGQERHGLVGGVEAVVPRFVQSLFCDVLVGKF